MPIGSVPPPTQHPDEQPLICIPVNVQWIPILLGALQPLKYPEYWGGTLEENKGARKDFGILIDQIMQGENCDMDTCCIPAFIIQRVSPTTGQLERSTDGGATWKPSPDTIATKIVTPVPPVTSGLAETKCDAATNAMTQIDDWISHVETAFGVAAGLVDFAIIVASAILDAVLVILSEGALTAAEGQIIAIIGAICTGVWAAGESVFADYWTSENKDIILCALFCNISDDGSFTDAQYNTFWSTVNSELPNSIAKSLFLGFMTSVGVQGLNAMSASGASADADCSDCDCLGGCDITAWDVLEARGTVVSGTKTSTACQIDASLLGDGLYWVSFSSPDTGHCCNIGAQADNSGQIYVVSGTPSASYYSACGHDPTDFAGWISLSFGSVDMNGFSYSSATPFTMAIDTTRT